MPDLLQAVSAYLLSEGVFRDPSDSTSVAPPLWLDPREGIPAPGEGEGTEIGANAVAGAVYGGQIPPADGEGYGSRDTIDFRLRVVTPDRVQPIAAALRDRFAPAIYGFRTDYVMGGLEVVISRQWRGLQRLSSSELGWDYGVSYLFETLIPTS